MFFVCDRGKIGSYLILLSTVVILFSIAMNFKKNNYIETSTKPDNIISNMIIENDD